jgi:hypothetical protein
MFGQRDNSCRHASHAAAIVILSTVLRTMSSYHARLLVPINTSFLLYAYIDSQQIFRTACWKTQHKRERVASFLDRTVKQVPHKIGFIGNKKGIFYCSSFFNLKQDWWHDYRDGPHACCTCNAQSSVLPSGISRGCISHDHRPERDIYFAISSATTLLRQTLLDYGCASSLYFGIVPSPNAFGIVLNRDALSSSKTRVTVLG